MTELFEPLLRRQKQEQWINALKQLSHDQKKALAPQLKVWLKEYNEFTGAGFNNNFRGTEQQRKMLEAAALVCLSQSDFEKKGFIGWFTDKSLMLSVLDWYCPTWFSNFYNKQGTNRRNIWSFFSYLQTMELAQKGFVQPSPELLALSLPMAVRNHENNKYHFAPENLFKYGITLKEHIWYMFEFEPNGNLGLGFLHVNGEQSKIPLNWADLFRQLSAEGKIDRQRLLTQSLLASHRNFNKNASALFADLFSSLEPTNVEILSLQKELLNVLHSPQAKPVSTALAFLKKVAADKTFDITGFIDQAPVLLSSTTKSNVTSCLSILEKLAKNNPVLQAQICSLATGVFIHLDESLQSRAARLINSHQTALNSSFRDTLSPYSDTMMVTAKTLLQQWLHMPGPGTMPPVHDTAVATASEWNAILIPQSLDDLVFLASQAFDNNQTWHFDVLPAALLHFHPLLQGSASDCLAPALQRALTLNVEYLRSGQGFLDHLLAVFFIDICQHLATGHPGGSLQSLLNNYYASLVPNQRPLQVIKPGAANLAAWGLQYRGKFYVPHKQIVLSALNRFKNGSPLPVLSTPTHEPAWIAPEIWVQRLAAYEQAGQPYDAIDMQVAIARCRLQQKENALSIAQQTLQGEYQRLSLFLLGHHPEPEGPFNDPAAWMMASLALPEKKTYEAFAGFGYYNKPFDYYTGQFEWQIEHKVVEESRYDYKMRKQVVADVVHSTLKVHYPLQVPEETKPAGGLKQWVSKLFGKPAETTAAPPILHDYRYVKLLHLDPDANDAARLFLLSPGNPEPMLADILSLFLSGSNFESEDRKTIVISILQCLLGIWGDMHNASHVFLAACMVSSDKTARQLAGEIWLKAVTTHQLNQAQPGYALAKLLQEEFVPAKRLTDLIEQQLFRVSALHNRHLLPLFEELLANLPDTPIKNLKKLLELYTETLAANQATVGNEAVQQKLTIWNRTAGLQKTIALLMK